MNKIIILLLFLTFYSFSQQYYISDVRGLSNKKSSLLYSKDAYGNLQNISSNKNIVGWYINNSDIVFVKDKNIEVTIKGGEKDIILKSDGITPSYFKSNDKNDNIFYIETLGYGINKNSRYSDYSTELIYSYIGDREIVFDLLNLEKNLFNIKLNNRNFTNYTDNKILYNFILFLSGNFKKAISEIEKDIGLANQYKSDYFLAMNYCILGNINFYKENYRQALYYYQLANDLMNNLVKDSIYSYKNYNALLYINLKIADLYYKYYEYENSKAFYLKAKDVMRKIDILEKAGSDITKERDIKSELINIDFWVTLRLSYIYKFESFQGIDNGKILSENLFYLQEAINKISNNIYDIALRELNIYNNQLEKIKETYFRQKSYESFISYLNFLTLNNDLDLDNKITFYKDYEELIKNYLKDNYDLSMVFKLIFINNKLIELSYSNEKFKDKRLHFMLSYFNERELFYYIPYDYNFQYLHIKYLDSISREYYSIKDLKKFFQYEFNKNYKLKSLVNNTTRYNNINNMYCVNLINLFETNYIFNNISECYKFLNELIKFLMEKYPNKSTEEYYYYLSISEDLAAKIDYKRLGGKDNNKNALERYNKALNIRINNLDNEKYKHLIVLSYINIGDVYLTQNKFNEAYENYKKSDELLGKDESELFIRSILNERFVLYNLMINKNELFKDLVVKNSDFDKNANISAFNLSNNILIGLNEVKNGKNNIGLDKFNESLKIINSLDEIYGKFNDVIVQKIIINYYLALTNFHNENMSASSKYFKDCLDSFNSITWMENTYYKIIFLGIYEKIIYYFFLINDYNSVITYFNQYENLFNDVYGVRNIEKTIFTTKNQLDTYIHLLNSLLLIDNKVSFNTYYNKFKSIINEELVKKNVDQTYILYYQGTSSSIDGYRAFVNKSYEESINFYQESYGYFKQLLALNNKSIDYAYLSGLSLYNIGIITKNFIDYNKGNKILIETQTILATIQNYDKAKTLIDSIRIDNSSKK